MRRKSEAKRRPSSFRSATLTSPSFSAIPHLSDQHNHRSEPPPEPVDLFDVTICICCDNNNKALQERVLVCHVSGCPVTVHASCIGSEPKFDDSGNFYCPYCWYKRALDTCQLLREKAMVAKKALSGFLDNKARARESQVQDREEHVERTEVEVNGDELVREECVDDTEAEENKDKTESEKNNDEQGREECVEKGESEGNEDEQGKEERVEDTESEENKDERKGFVSVMGSSVSEAESEGVSIKKRRDQKKSMLAEEGKHYGTRGKVASSMVEEEVTSSRTLRPRQRSPAKGKKLTLLSVKRRRLLWTAEEEKVLKEGVLKFSTENQNIPWRKILEFGCRVFDNTRTPVDLKDKWRNIIKGLKQLLSFGTIFLGFLGHGISFNVGVLFDNSV